MKKYYTLLFTLLIGSVALSQSSYSLIQATNAGINPAFLNSEAENPGQDGWTTIMSTSATDKWSSSQSIPFTFEFAGAAVSSFYVSASGVLTFSSSPGTAPGSSNLGLPSTSIPDKSVCMWGLNLEGTNDALVSKVIGSAPNRQLWVQWNSASAPEFTGTHQWAYWSIVLEETTNNIFVVDQRTYDGNAATPTGNNVALTVGVQENSTTALQLAASPNVASNTITTAGSLTDATDNSFYQFVPGMRNSNDMAGIYGTVTPLVQTGFNVFIEGVFQNLGDNVINSADFNYKVSGGSTVTSPVGGVFPITAGEYLYLSSTTGWTPPNDGAYTIEAWLTNINGSADANTANDKITITVNAVGSPPQKKTVLEERTGTWCGWCPRGMVAMEYLGLNHHEDATLIAVHNSDPMAIQSYDSRLSGGFPTFTADRIETALSLNQQSMIAKMNERNALIPPAGLTIKNINYNSATGSISVDVEAQFFVDDQNADYRYNVILTENGVRGSSNGYAQVNYYAGGTNGPMVTASGFDYSTAPDPVPASQMVYDHVAISLSPNFDGNSGDIPGNITFAQKVNTTLTTTLPASAQNENHVYVNVILLDNNNNGEAVNSAHKKLTNTVGLDENDLIKANVYPNPANDHLSIEVFDQTEFSVEIVNAVGQVVFTNNYENTDRARVNTSTLKPGMYLVNVMAGAEKSTINVVINH